MQQKLRASPCLQQAVKLLQLPVFEFEQELRKAIETNPFLEEREESPPAAEAPSPETGAIEAANEPGPAGEEAWTPSEVSPALTATDTSPPAAPGPSSTVTRSRGEDDRDPMDRACVDPDLRERLHEQVCGVQMDDRERLVAQLVIETLEDDGYLRGSVAETARALSIDPPITDEEIEKAIRAVQEFEPCGVAARDLSECLLLQLEAMDEETPGRALAMAVAKDGLDLLARHDQSALTRRFDCSPRAMTEAAALIRTLDPRPGEAYAPTPSNYVTADVLVTEKDGRLVASINPQTRPRARLNREYVTLFRRSRDEASPALRQQLQEARWLLRNAEQRFVTILRVAEAIIDVQREFFTYGDAALKPLLQRDVAQMLGIHESTVSRATGNKYMATPRGVLPFSHFFSPPLEAQDGSKSATAVRAMMRDLIDQENPRRPLSDVALARRLREQGISVARRTVSKYRSLMRVPPAELRRRA
ncbi:MAG TPA: RNA polymerase factor sigma-54 [Nevskiaceae bacterium]|nr:RNA polymerase factor sigma-54 [Nevskiaceae bacterium]